MLWIRLHFVFVASVINVSCFTATVAAQADDIDFSRQIRPILSNHCFPCHGPDANQRQTELRFDDKTSMFADLGGYAAFVPGNPGESEALRRVHSDDPGELMPPPDSKLELTDEQRTLLREWIEHGAKWSEHWAFVPPRKPNPPAVELKTWPVNELDRFVLARLESNGLEPSPPSDPVTLIRRVTLDLTGMPPTPDEVDAFLNDESPDAYKKVVDRLLASPRYGERMAWDWLDAARYADTDGFQADPTRDMWPWRDWLINALNDNMPFDQFTVEMLAGDLLPSATSSQVLATGFNRNHMYNGEGGRIPEETRVENVFDRTETTSTVWLGLTMTCARCHDHKFDPISQKEYYALSAFFNNTSESGAGGNGKAPPTIDYYTPAQTTQLEQLNNEIQLIAEELNAPDAQLDALQIKWEREKAAELKEYDLTKQVVTLRDWWMIGPFPPAEDNATELFDRNFGPEPDVKLDRKYGSLEWQQTDQFKDGKTHSLPNTVGATYLFRRIQSGSERLVELSLGSDDAIKVWLNGKLVLSNNTARGVAPDQEQVRVNIDKGSNDLLMKIVNTGGAAGFYFRKKSESILGLPSNVAKALSIDRHKRNEQQLVLLLEHFRSNNSATWRALRKQQADLNARKQKIEQASTRVMVMDSLPTERKRKTYVLSRGTYNKPLDQVSLGAPAFLPPMPKEPQKNRLGLARWIVSANNPLTARVTVNRYWQMFFGRGLVETSEDFGRQGAQPSHPKLLDWLATTFVESGWDVKALHKQIVMSATYRQSSRATRGEGSLYEIDPKNRLFARGPRFRMPSWMLRDQALAISGLLVDRLGGPPVNPYQPEGIWAEATFGKIKYKQGSGEDLYRRSIYTFWRRIVGPTMFFDNGARQTCVVRPLLTNSPLHALTTLNETTFVESARALAQRALLYKDQQQSELTAEDRISYAFRLAAARRPSQNELGLLVQRLNAMRLTYRDDVDAATGLLSVGDSSRDETLDPAEHAAYTVICSLILNLDEVLTKE